MLNDDLLLYLYSAKLVFRVSSPMALRFACFFLCLHFLLHNFYVSCENPELPPYVKHPNISPLPSPPNISPRPCPGRCGGINILPPFFLINTSSIDTCEGNYSIRCDNGSVPMIKFADREFVVKYIYYEKGVFLLLDLEFSSYLSQGQCGFLYNFTVPIQNFTLPPRSPNLDLNSPFRDCKGQTDAFSQAFFPMINNSRHCNDYNLYFWDEPRNQSNAALNCLVDEASFEWVLAFDGYNDHLSLESAGFSRQFKLSEDCLYCRVTGQSCTGNSGTADSSCSCQNICRNKEKGVKRAAIIGIGNKHSALELFFFLFSLEKSCSDAYC